MNLGMLMCPWPDSNAESVCERPGFALCMKKGGIRFSKSFRGGAAETLTASEVLIRGVWLPLKRKFVPGRNNSPGVEGTHTIISWAGFNHGPFPSCSVFPCNCPQIVQGIIQHSNTERSVCSNVSAGEQKAVTGKTTAQGSTA